MIIWMLLIVAWIQAGMFLWALAKLNDAEREKEEAVNWCAAHMLYEKEKGYPLMETDHMGSYYHRAKLIRKKMAEDQKKKGGGKN